MYKQELALTNEMELFVFTWANQSFVCYVTFFISCSPHDLPARHATLKNSCKTKTTIDFLACYCILIYDQTKWILKGIDNILMSGYGNKCQNACRGKLNKRLIKLAGERI